MVPNDRKPTGELHDPRLFDHYLAGPMTGYPEYNYPAFDAATITLRQSGFVIFSPHEVPWPEGHNLMAENDLWEYMMRQTDVLLNRCNSIILLGGWASSRGAKQELVKGFRNNFHVFTFAHNTLMGWDREYVHAHYGQ